MQFDDGYFQLPNFLSSGSIEDIFGFDRLQVSIGQDPYGTDYTCVDQMHRLYLPESRYLSAMNPHLGFGFSSATLDFPNDPEYVQERQDAVRALLNNEKLAGLFHSWFDNRELNFLQSEHSVGRRQDVRMKMYLTPKDIRSMCEQLEDAVEGVNTPVFERVGDWVAMLRDDPVANEFLRASRKIKDSAIIARFDERYAQVQYGVPRGSLDEHVVWLTPEDTRFVVYRKPRRNPQREQRSVVRHRTDADEADIELAVGHARQSVQDLNYRTAGRFGGALLAGLAQLHQLYRGAVFHNTLQRAGYPVIFPDVTNNIGEFQGEGIYPLHLALREFTDQMQRIGSAHHVPSTSSIRATNYDLSGGRQVVQIIGPNNEGKTEALRTLHYSAVATNAGWPLLAREVRVGPVPRSHMFSFRENPSRGSALASIATSLQSFLSGTSLRAGDRVMFDELGDATNTETARTIASELLPLLQDRGVQVVMTTHDTGVTSLVEELGGRSLVPDEQYQLRDSQGRVDFKAEQTVQELGLTRDNLGSLLREDSNRGQEEREFVDIKDLEPDVPF